MKENKLTELSMEFSVDIIILVKHLKPNHESIISNQIGRRISFQKGAAVADDQLPQSLFFIRFKVRS